jgi:uncharacterized membrane protein
MTLYFLVKYLHVLGAIVILGTGSGIAFFMLMAHRSGEANFIARTAATVVLADMLFTLTAVILQPISGGLLMMLSSTTFAEGWIVLSLALSGFPWCSSRSKCAIWRKRRPWAASRCRRAISRCFAAGSVAAFPASAR